MNPLPLVNPSKPPVPPGPQRLVLRELDLERQLAELRLALLGPRVPVRASVASRAPDPLRLTFSSGYYGLSACALHKTDYNQGADHDDEFLAVLVVMGWAYGVAQIWAWTHLEKN